MSRTAGAPDDADEASHETCRRHRDGHRLVHRQQHPGSAGEPARGEVRHRRAPTNTPSSASAARCTARRRSMPSESVDRRAMRFLGGGTAWNHVAMEQAIRDAGLEENEISQRAHRHHHGLGRPVDARHRRGRRHRAHQGPEARRPVRGAEGDVVDRLGDARHLVQDQGRQLFDLVGLRDLQPLHRQCRRD